MIMNSHIGIRVHINTIRKSAERNGYTCLPIIHNICVRCHDKYTRVGIHNKILLQILFHYF